MVLPQLWSVPQAWHQSRAHHTGILDAPAASTLWSDHMKGRPQADPMTDDGEPTHGRGPSSVTWRAPTATVANSGTESRRMTTTEPRPAADHVTRTDEYLRPRRPAKVPPAAWKLVVAVEAPWCGELYNTRPDRERFAFATVESFCAALLAATGWSVDFPSTDAPPSNPPDRGPGSHREGRPRPRQTREHVPVSGKFIVAADGTWTGVMYRTRPGLGHFPFDTFEGFLCATLDITGWTLD